MLAHAQTRLVTLTGPPGIGKTRLGVACASAYAQRSGCATVFADLAPVRDPALVMVELAQAVGVEPRGGMDLTGQLAAALGDEERLVVLDNCEHVLAAAPDVGQVLAACPRLRVLATSRERLRLSAEQEFPVPPLAMPAPADVADLGGLAANPSVALLLDRARRTNPSFDLTSANALLLASVCIQLEGLPLAIELAAARLKVLTPGEMLFRLGSRMEVLAGSTRDVPVRQRALRNAIAWSYDLLDPGERALFRRLSVFAGGWTLADVASVCAVSDGDALAVVESLLDKSLIRRLPGDEETAEFAMLESLREYAAEQLASHAEAEETRARHAGHYAGLATQFEAAIGLPEERTWMLWVLRHHVDLRSALDYCLGAGQDGWALSLATALGWYHYTRGDLGQGQALVDRVLSLGPGQHDPATMSDDAMADGLAGALIVAGVLAWATGEADRSQDLLLRALERSEERADTRRAAIACAFLGNCGPCRRRVGRVCWLASAGGGGLPRWGQHAGGGLGAARPWAACPGPRRPGERRGTAPGEPARLPRAGLSVGVGLVGMGSWHNAERSGPAGGSASAAGGGSADLHRGQRPQGRRPLPGGAGLGRQ